MQQGEQVIVRQETPDELPSIDSLDTSDIDGNEQTEWPDAA
jgi:hypothetical protein